MNAFEIAGLKFKDRAFLCPDTFMDDRQDDARRTLGRLEDGYGEIPVRTVATTVPRDYFAECVDAALDDRLGGVRVLVTHGDSFLLVRRGNDDEWDVPGGSLAGDVHETAAQRLVAEQTGLECSITDAFAAVEREFTLVDGGDGVSGLWVFFEAEAFDTDLSLADPLVDAEWFTSPPSGIDPAISEHLEPSAPQAD